MSEKELDIKVNVDAGAPNIGLNLFGRTSDIALALSSNGIPISRDQVISNTKSTWDERIDFIPKAGQIILYTDYFGPDLPAIKIGDGLAYLIDLPVIGNGLAQQLSSILASHLVDHSRHVTDEEKSFWNNKLNLEISGEELILNRS